MMLRYLMTQGGSRMIKEESDTKCELYPFCKQTLKWHSHIREIVKDSNLGNKHDLCQL